MFPALLRKHVEISWQIDICPQSFHRGKMFLFILSHLPWFWLFVCVVCILLEAATTSLTTIWFACGSFLMIFLSFISFPFRYQFLIFALISLLLLIFTRPFAVKKLHVKKIATNSDRLIGRKCIVTQRITELQKGAVKIDGVEWTAEAAGEKIEKGTEVEITEIRGATLVVKIIGRDES